MIVLIDNYDSFSYNLYQLVGEVAGDVAAGSARAPEEIRVIRNDAVSVADVAAMHPSALLLSPGPGRPADAGICEELARELTGEVPILGVCLGHQAICEALGGEVTYARRLMHGKSSLASLDVDCPLFSGLPAEIGVARYHSLAASADALPKSLSVVARTADGEVMAVAHREHPTFGLQFHPESILTPDGRAIVENFLRM